MNARPIQYTGIRSAILPGMVKKKSKIFGVTTDKIVKTVADYFQLTPAQIRGRDRHGHLTIPRMISMHLAIRTGKYTLQELGKYYSGRDHSSIIYNRDVCRDLMFFDKNLKRQIEELEATLYR